MAAPTFDETAPVITNNWDDDVDQIRDGRLWLMTAAASCKHRLPGWTTTYTGSDLSKPDSITMTKGGLGMQWVNTYNGSDQLTQEVWKFKSTAGGSYETFTGGTLTITYDGSGNLSGVSSS